MKKDVRSIFSIAIPILVLSFGACDSGERTSKTAEETNSAKADTAEIGARNEVDPKDAQFVSEVVAFSYGEIRLAQLGQKKLAAELKQLAEMIELDHTRSLNDLKAIASTRNIPVPSEESEADKTNYTQLEGLSGAAFHDQWIRIMQTRHEQSIRKFETELVHLKNVNLKNWVERNLPLVRAHREKLINARSILPK